MSARRVTPSRIFAGTFRSITTAYSVAVAFAGVPESCALAAGTAKQTSATATAHSAFAPCFRGTPAGFRSFDECALPSHRLHRSLQSWNFFGWLLALRQSRRAQQLYPRDLNPDDTEFWEALWPAARCFLPQFSGSLANLGSSGLPTAANPNFRNSLEGLEANFAERIRLCS